VTHCPGELHTAASRREWNDRSAAADFVSRKNPRRRCGRSSLRFAAAWESRRTRRSTPTEVPAARRRFKGAIPAQREHNRVVGRGYAYGGDGTGGGEPIGIRESDDVNTRRVGGDGWRSVGSPADRFDPMGMTGYD
jgi:hypothetical protein